MEPSYPADKCVIYVLFKKAYVSMDWIVLFCVSISVCCREILSLRKKILSLSQSYFLSFLFSGSITSEAKIHKVHANVWVGYLTEDLWRVISFLSENFKLFFSLSSTILKMQHLKLVTRQIQQQIGRSMGRILQHSNNFTFLV